MAEPASDGLFGAITNFFNGPPAKQSTTQGNLSKFVHHVNSGGIAFNHLFLVSIGPKKGSTSTLAPDFVEKINMFCHSTSVPALNIMTAPYRENAAHYEVPYGHSVEPLTMVFYGDRNMMIKDYFDEWYHDIVNPQVGGYTQSSKGNLRLNFMHEICADIDIHIIEKSQNKSYSMRLINAYPKSIGDVQLSHNNPDVISFPIQFVYERIEQLNPGSSTTPVEAPIAKQRAFPLSVWDQAVGASGELMQAATTEIEGLQGKVNTLLNAPATMTNDVTVAIRDRVTIPNIPSFHELFG
jgi:hypothetical protein